MKKRIRILVSVLAVIICLAAVLSGCGGSSQPTEEDAQKYVKAVLDLMCTGEYDKSVKFADVEEGQETAMRDEMVDEMLESVAEQYPMDDETREQFRDFILRAFSCCKYSVGSAVKTEDDGGIGYDVTVSIEPLKVFEGSVESLQKEMEELTSDVDKLMNMTQDEMYSLVYEALFKVLNRNLDAPSYEDPKEIVVHYGLIDEENKIYGTSKEDGEKLGQALFSMAGLE